MVTNTNGKSTPKSSGRKNRTSPVSEKIEIVGIETITPSSENDDIYGKIDCRDHELRSLAIDIRENGIREPLVVSDDDYIVSGHRRYAAAIMLKLTTIPIRRIELKRIGHTDIEWKRVLAGYNRQRVKSAATRIKESLLAIDPDIAHRQLIAARAERDGDSPKEISISGMMTRSEISSAKMPMLVAVIDAINDLKKFWPMTVRQVHYRLLNDPPLRHAKKPDSAYRNDRKSYSDLCDLLARARLESYVPWNAIADETRPVSGTNYYCDAAEFIDRESAWYLRGYRRDLLQSQHDHIELVAEKLTVQGIVKPIAERYCVPLTIGRGYCSLDPRRAIAQRFKSSGKDRLIILVASDLDPDGESIAESFARSIRDDFGIESIKPIKALLTMDQVDDWNLPPNEMEAKKSSAQYAAYRRKYKTNRVFELEAIDPARMQSSLAETIESVLDLAAFNLELEKEKQDAVQLQSIKHSVSEHLLEIGFGGDE